MKSLIALFITFVILIVSAVIFTTTDNEDIKYIIMYVIGPICGGAFLLFLGSCIFPEE